MIGPYEPGDSPSCSACRYGCEPVRYDCAEIAARNHRMSLLAQIARVIRQERDPEARKDAAAALYDAYVDEHLPLGWLSEREWMDACGVARKVVAA